MASALHVLSFMPVMFSFSLGLLLSFDLKNVVACIEVQCRDG